MKGKNHRSEIVVNAGSRRKSDTQREIRNFLRALSSYPERFADDPCVSFEQHLFSIASGSIASGDSGR